MAESSSTQEQLADQNGAKEEDEEEEVEHSQWSNLPCEILESNIICRLQTPGNLRCFSGVCRRWRSIALQVKHIYRPPWLMLAPDSNGVCTFFDPLIGRYRKSRIPELSDIEIQYSKDSWLLVSRKNYESIFFFNPLTRSRINIPTARLYCYKSQVFAFSSAPTSPGCVVLALGSYRPDIVVIRFYHKGEPRWTNYYHNDLLPLGIWSNPVFCNGNFYAMNAGHNLWAFDPSNHTRRVINVPQMDLPKHLKHELCWENRYMVEFRGQIFVMFTYSSENKPIIFKFDQFKLGWEKVRSLGDRICFASLRSSLMTTSVPNMVDDRIYFTEVVGQKIPYSCTSYSLVDAKYYPSTTRQDRGNKEIRQNIWIQPP